MPELTQSDVDEAHRINDHLNQHLERVRQDPDLSSEGKVRQIAGYYEEYEQEMSALRQRFEINRVETEQNLSRDLFGAAVTSGTDAISARDADDRASRLEDPEEALRLLARADENGDHILARAIAQHAFSKVDGAFGGRAWGPVVDAYASRRPDVEAKIQRLHATRRDSLKAALHRGMLFHVPKPAELQRLMPNELAALKR